MSAARRETKKSGAPDRRRYIQVARETTSVGGALQETSDPFGNSEEVARLYTELVNSFGSNDSEAIRLIYRALLRLGGRARKSLPRWRGLPQPRRRRKLDRAAWIRPSLQPKWSHGRRPQQFMHKAVPVFCLLLRASGRRLIRRI